MVTASALHHDILFKIFYIIVTANDDVPGLGMLSDTDLFGLETNSSFFTFYLGNVPRHAGPSFSILTSYSEPLPNRIELRILLASLPSVKSLKITLEEAEVHDVDSVDELEKTVVILREFSDSRISCGGKLIQAYTSASIPDHSLGYEQRF
ncbi:hypothetical protein CPC08DRAFT_765204 [Agrocybe pediades]|nr:hypothetical protein CPC08DRAFT_765204 [Agrocybe pediades]